MCAYFLCIHPPRFTAFTRPSLHRKTFVSIPWKAFITHYSFSAMLGGSFVEKQLKYLFVKVLCVRCVDDIDSIENLQCDRRAERSFSQTQRTELRTCEYVLPQLDDQDGASRFASILSQNEAMGQGTWQRSMNQAVQVYSIADEGQKGGNQPRSPPEQSQCLLRQTYQSGDCSRHSTRLGHVHILRKDFQGCVCLIAVINHFNWLASKEQLTHVIGYAYEALELWATRSAKKCI